MGDMTGSEMRAQIRRAMQMAEGEMEAAAEGARKRLAALRERRAFLNRQPYDPDAAQQAHDMVGEEDDPTVPATPTDLF